MELSEFMGTPNSEKQVLPVKPLDTTRIDEQNAEEVDISRTAERIWNAGGAFAYICRSCSLFHSGDHRVIRIMVLSFMSTLVLNSYGMHINVSGDAGTGKSHCATTVSDHFPVIKVKRGRMSDKALFHHDFKSGCLFILDDQSPSEDLEEIVKESTTNFHEETTYYSVKNGNAIEQKIPPESVFWMVKVEILGDEQTQDRMFNLRTDNSDEQLDAIKGAIISAAKDPSLIADVTSKLISRKIWEQVPKAYVSIPYADYISNEERPEARNLNLFLDLIRTSALFHAPLREHGPEINGKLHILANLHDFNIAARLMNPLMNNIGGSQKNKIDGNGQKILDWLEANYTYVSPDPIAFSTIRDALGFRPEVMTYAINGRSDRGTYSLEKKCPAVEIVNMNNPNRSAGGTFSGKGIRWNPHVYAGWKGKGGMFALDLPKGWKIPEPTKIEIAELEEIKKDDAEEAVRLEHEKDKTRSR